MDKNVAASVLYTLVANNVKMLSNVRTVRVEINVKTMEFLT